MKIKLEDIKNEVGASSISKKDGVITVRRGFFYTGGKEAHHFVSAVRVAYPNAMILDSGEVYKPFRGGASVSQSSHWYVKFKLGA